MQLDLRAARKGTKFGKTETNEVPVVIYDSDAWAPTKREEIKYRKLQQMLQVKIQKDWERNVFRPIKDYKYVYELDTELRAFLGYFTNFSYMHDPSETTVTSTTSKRCNN
jgi:hypothetical protein